MRGERVNRGWAALLLTAAACGGGEPEPPPSDPNIPLAELCSELAEADCARLERCGTLPAPFDASTCRTQQEAVMCGPTQAAIAASVNAGASDYFELAARDCRAAVEALPCEVGLDHDVLALSACRSMLAARGGAGDSCHLGFDCQDGLYCADGGACPGTCTTLVGNNEPCTFGDRCDDALYCDVTAMRCLARTDLGGTCSLALSGRACVDGSFCDRSNPAAPTCVAARGRNEGCTSDAECAQGARCVGNRCSAGLEGDACSDVAPCAPELRCSAGSCRSPRAEDEACGPATPPCAAGLTCTSTMGASVCLPQVALGGACGEETAGCLLGRCEAEVCVASLDDGAACARAEECLSGRLCEGGRCTVVPRDCRP